jgi:hypothetical protein
VGEHELVGGRRGDHSGDHRDVEERVGDESQAAGMCVSCVTAST